MGFFYTTQLRTRLNAGASLNNRTMKVTFMARSPLLNDDDARASLRNATTLAGLLSQDGWAEVSSANYVAPTTVTPLTTVGNNNYIVLNTSLLQLPATMAPSSVQAIVLSVDGADIGLAAGDKVLFGTTTPFGSGVTMKGGDGISGRVDTAIGQRWLFGYALSGGVVSAITEGTTVVQQSAPPFEASHVSHSWLIPQRVNYVANPSWEGGVTHWQTTAGVMTREVALLDFPSHWVGRATGAVPGPVLPQYNPADRLYLKSNAFYPRNNNMTFQIMAKGVGIARVGLAYWPRDYSEHASDWGLLDTLLYEEWLLDANNFVPMRGVRRMSDGYEAALIIEVRGDLFGGGRTPGIYLDLGLVEEGVLLDWHYFDGDTTFGGQDDFSWYGDVPLATKRGKSYSLWYNNRRAVGGRLFGRRLDDTALYTSADEQLDSLVSQWTPAGAVVYPHWDVLTVNDLQTMPVDRSATTLTRDLWPEQVQPFATLSQQSVVATASIVSVVGEGAYPVTGGYMLSGTTAYPVTAILLDDEIDPYDLSKPRRYQVSWPSVPAFETHTLYLHRGPNPLSPSSWVAVIPATNLGAAVTGAGAVTALDVTPLVKPTAVTATAAGVGSNASFGVGTPNITTAIGTGTGQDTLRVSATTGGPETPTGAGVAENALCLTLQVTTTRWKPGDFHLTGLCPVVGATIIVKNASTGVVYTPMTTIPTAAGTYLWDWRDRTSSVNSNPPPLTIAIDLGPDTAGPYPVPYG